MRFDRLDDSSEPTDELGPRLDFKSLLAGGHV